MAIIEVLDSLTIDKIAAGEVVERPTSVVKELVENAMDANATAITVEIKEGGNTFIRITDNGSGISKDQVKKAFYRHATSKIKSALDLFKIHSLGFRGEALSSIAAVAQVEMITKVETEVSAIHYRIEGGKEILCEEIGAPTGTTLIVRNLFYNTPARRKFLKSSASEGNLITDLMEHLCLSRPDISFKYLINNKVKLQTSGNGDVKEIIYRIYGRDVVSHCIMVESETSNLKITGYLGKPELNRANRNNEIFFVNNRYIKSSFLQKAVEEGYRSFLMQHRYPFVVLHFEVSSDLIDVNVHPTKMDIRFTNQQEVFQEIVDCIYQGLHKKELIPKVEFGTVTKEEKQVEKEQVAKEQVVLREPEPFEVKRRNGNENTPINLNLFNSNKKQIKILQEQEAGEDFFYEEKIELEVVKEQILPVEQAKVTLIEDAKQLELFEDKLLVKSQQNKYEVLGQLFHTYWVISFQDTMYLMDQHAAHEKIKYERLIKRIQDNKILSQTLNPPIIISMTAKEENTFFEFEEVFVNLGFEVESFGGNEYAIRSVPVDLFGQLEKNFFLNVLDELSESNKKELPSVICEKIASMACKAAVKGNSKMSILEVEALMGELMTLENPYHCPHGRPTIIAMTKYEIDKKFKRIL